MRVHALPGGASGRTLTRTARGDGWPVRAQLLLIVAIVAVLVAAAGTAVASATFHGARNSARATAQFKAKQAAGALDQSLNQAQAAMVGLASGLDIQGLIANPSSCRLTFSGLGVFPAGHIDVVLPSGQVPCSSISHSGAPTGATQAGAAWLTTAANRRAVAVTPTFRDQLTGQTAIAITAPISSSSGRFDGFAALVLPTGGLDQGLTAAYAGPQQFTFTVHDADGRLLSAPSTDPHGEIVANFMASQSRWQVTAAVPSATALAASRAVLMQVAALGVGAILLLLLLLVAVNRRIVRPLRRLTVAVAHAARRHSLDTVDVGGPREVRQLASEFNATLATRSSYEDQLVQHALHDPLTGLPNRALFLDRTRVATQAASATGAAAVFSIDLDRFKTINSGLGYPAGDTILIGAADRLAGICRTGDTLARTGDGYLICKPSITSLEDATMFGARILDCLAVPFTVAGTEVTITASVGIATSRPGWTADQAIADADIAMHAAKDRGGAQYRLIDDALRDASSNRLALETDLRTALRNNELHVFYQPVVDLLSNEITGAEALLRWNHPTRGQVPPTTFIPIAEQTDLIGPIGRYVLETACAQAAAWHRSGRPIRISVNISGRQLLDQNFPTHVAHVLDTTGLPAPALCLELTETILMDDATRCQTALAEISHRGIGLSVDDFGTGYSSLAYLKRFPVTELKIDRSFVSNLDTNTEDSALVAAMIAMGHALGLHVVAEGIETQSQAATIITLGCRSAQGYLFSKPQPTDDFSLLLATGLPNRRRARQQIH